MGKGGECGGKEKEQGRLRPYYLPHLPHLPTLPSEREANPEY